ncbi:hypothetical protein GCM10020256_66970 [Streptomyces thermocoprophilus]
MPGHCRPDPTTACGPAGFRERHDPPDVVRIRTTALRLAAHAPTLTSCCASPTTEPADPSRPPPARRGLTRIEAHTPGRDPGALRVLLVADLLVRALELGGTPVCALLDAGQGREELRAAAAALGMRPLEDGHAATAGLGEAQIVHVAQDPDAAPPASC